MNSNWSYSPETLNSGQNWQYFVLCDLEIWCMALENNRACLLYYIKLCASFQIHRWSQTWVTVRKCSIWVKICDFSCPAWPWNWMDDLKKQQGTFLYYIKLCASFQSHEWIQTGLTVRKRSIRVKICTFLSLESLKFDRWPENTIGHLFYAASSFVHDFIPTGEFKLGLQSWNAQFGSKLALFCPLWPRNLGDDLEKQ